MLDLGIQKGKNKSFDDEDYDSYYLSELEVDEEITGEIYVSELKTKDFKGQEIHQFYLIITDHNSKEKWVCGINTSAYNNKGIISIYGEKGGRVYQLIDSLNHALNGTELEHLESYSVVFTTFQETINEKVGNVTVKAVESTNSNAKSPNLCIMKAGTVDDNNKQGEADEDVDEIENDDPHILNDEDDPKARELIRKITDYLIESKGIPATDIDDKAIRLEAKQWRKKDKLSKKQFKKVREQLKRRY